LSELDAKAVVDPVNESYYMITIINQKLDVRNFLAKSYLTIKIKGIDHLQNSSLAVRSS